MRNRSVCGLSEGGHIDPTNSTFALSGTNLVATATQLQFDFSAYGDALFDNPNQLGNIFWGLEGTLGGALVGACSGTGCETVRTVAGAPLWTAMGWGASAGVVVADVNPVGTTAVPEPATLSLLGLGLVALRATLRARRK